MRRVLDINHDGQVSFEEFSSLIKRQQAPEGPREIYKAFQSFNVSKTGEISIADLHEKQYSVTEHDIKEIHGGRRAFPEKPR
eukprot:gene33380-50712_t